MSPKLFQKRVELMTSEEKAALDHVMRYMATLPSNEKISLEDARIIFEAALRDMQAEKKSESA